MAWGNTDYLDRSDGNGGWRAKVADQKKMQVVFVSSGDFALNFFRVISDRSLAFNEVAIVRGSDAASIDEDDLAKKIDGTKVVVVGTCKCRSVVKGSRAQKIESLAIEHARRTGARIVLFSEYAHEATLPHLEPARHTTPIVMIRENTSGPGGFLDLLLMGTEFVPVGNDDDSLTRMGAVILRQRRGECGLCEGVKGSRRQ